MNKGVNRVADFARIRSDYSPDTGMTMAMSDDGDIAIKIIGTGEMRIATSGGQFHGNDLCRVVEAFRNVIEVINDVTGQKLWESWQ